MRIDESKLNIPSTWKEVYRCVNYRRYDRIKYLTDIETELGTLGIMVSIRRTKIILHAFIGNLYFKYNRQMKHYTDTRAIIKYIVVKWHKKFIEALLKYKEETLLPFEFFRIMDKMIATVKLKKRNTRRIVQHYVLNEDNKHKYVIFSAIDKIVSQNENITETNEGFIGHTGNWILKLPYDKFWVEQYSLNEINVGDNYTLAPKLSYPKFLESVKDWTSDEVVEVIGRYKMMTPYEYSQDPRRVLYRLLYRRKAYEKYKTL